MKVKFNLASTLTICPFSGPRLPPRPPPPSHGVAVFPQYPYIVGSGAANVTGDEVCKTGPPIPYASDKKNVLIVGDSVSIGYTPFVAKVMNATAFVQHSPWGGDGGAEETLYGARCIENLIRAPDGTTLSPDVLMFNWGLHNSLAGNCTPPYVPTSPVSERSTSTMVMC